MWFSATYRCNKLGGVEDECSRLLVPPPCVLLERVQLDRLVLLLALPLHHHTTDTHEGSGQAAALLD